jgi:dethiobiotin synthetase
MKKIIFVTATNTNVGKTYACKVLLKKLHKRNKKVGYFKPIETGVKNIASDGSAILKFTKKLNKSYKKLTIDDIVPYQFKLPAAPFVAKKNKKISTKKILKQINYLFGFCDVLVVEGAGGLMVPILENYFMIDLIKDISNKFNTKVVLITSSKLGCINDTLLSQMALKNYNLNYKWYINLFEDKQDFFEVTYPFYQKYFKKISFLN